MIKQDDFLQTADSAPVRPVQTGDTEVIAPRDWPLICELMDLSVPRNAMRRFLFAPPAAQHVRAGRLKVEVSGRVQKVHECNKVNRFLVTVDPKSDRHDADRHVRG